MKYLNKVVSISTLLITVALNANVLNQPSKIIINTIHNDSSYSLKLTDRLTLNSLPLTIQPGQTIQTSIDLNNAKKVVIMGNMKDIMANEAQYLIQKIEQDGTVNSNEEVYLNIHTCPGGVDDGSGIICGKVGTTVMNFLMAGKQGGCIMSSGRLPENDNATSNFKLTFFTDKYNRTVGSLEVN